MDIQRNGRFAELWGKVKIELLESGVAHLGTEWHNEDVCSPYSRLYYVISGSGIIRLPKGGQNNGDGGIPAGSLGQEAGMPCMAAERPAKAEKKILCPGHIYLIPNGLYYQYYCEDTLDKLYFHINVLMPDGFDLFRGCGKCPEISAGMDRILRAKALYESGKPEDYLRLRGEIYSALAELVAAADVSDKLTHTYSPLLNQLFSVIHRNITCGLTIKELAAQLHVSESTLSKQFKKETGMPLGRYMEQRILGKARQFLVASPASIGEIAAELGFCDQFYFSRYFKERQGETPSAYRRRYAPGR